MGECGGGGWFFIIYLFKFFLLVGGVGLVGAEVDCKNVGPANWKPELVSQCQ